MILSVWRGVEPLRLLQIGPELGKRGSYSATFGPHETRGLTRPKRGGRRGLDVVQARRLTCGVRSCQIVLGPGRVRTAWLSASAPCRLARVHAPDQDRADEDGQVDGFCPGTYARLCSVGSVHKGSNMVSAQPRRQKAAMAPTTTSTITPVGVPRLIGEWYAGIGMSGVGRT